MRIETSSSASPCFTVVNADRGSVGTGDDVDAAGDGVVEAVAGGFRGATGAVTSACGAVTGSRLSELAGAEARGEVRRSPGA